MNNKEISKITRRAFLAVSTTTAVSFGTVAQTPNTAKVVPKKISPNEKLNVAAIGAGGKGLSDIMNCHKLGHNVVALCDVDWKRAEEAFYRLPNAKKYKDYRNMLEEMKEIDAVTISTPDHSHAHAAYTAMKLGKHVYVQKPLTHTIAEARLLTLTAREMGVATQMGNQGHCGDGVRQLCEMIWSGAIGQVKEVHIWTHRPVWDNQGRTEPLPAEVAPEEIDWDRWLNGAPYMPYNHKLAPHDWRAWQFYGSGSLGDMACHIMDPAYWALKLYEAPEFSVEVVWEMGKNDLTFPIATTIKYSFPARGDMGPVDVYWYDGHWEDKSTGKKVYNRPKRPEGIPENEVLGDDNMNGSLFIGEKGMLTAGEYGGDPRLVPSELMKDYTLPPQTIERIPDENPYYDWLRACKEGKPACSNFDYSGPFTEMVQFGNLAIKTGKKLIWDNVNGVVKNVPNPKEIITKEYRKGWELPC